MKRLVNHAIAVVVALFVVAALMVVQAGALPDFDFLGYVPYTAKNAGALPEPAPQRFVYPVKFVCGSIPGSGDMHATEEPPVKPGNYATAINIHNLFDEAAAFTVRTSVAGAVPDAGVTGWVSQPTQERLERLQAMEIDCRQILEPLGGEAPRFVKGFARIESAKELDVVAVYTSEKLEVQRECDPVLADVNTGEPGWRLVDQPADAPGNVPRAATVVSPFSTWNAPLPGSSWISTDSNRGQNYLRNKGGGNALLFVYQYQFELSQACTDQAQMTLDYRADDNAKIELNGTLVANWVPGLGPNKPPATVTASGPFVAGMNTLKVTVRDTGRIVTGLDVAGAVRSRVKGVGTGMSMDVEYIEPRTLPRGQ